MFRICKTREYSNGEFMIAKIRCFYCVVALVVCFVGTYAEDAWFSLQNTGPSNVDISGVFYSDDNLQLNGSYESVLEFYNEDASIPTVNLKETILIQNNYFRVSLNLKSALIPIFKQQKTMFLRITLSNGISTVLPFASVPTTIKSSYSNTTKQLMDESLFYVDYEQARVGIGTKTPQSLVHVVGDVKATSFVGDGSGLTDLPFGGNDGYYYLNSLGGKFSAVITVNANGNLMIGGRPKIDYSDAHLQVYGSFLVQSNDTITSNIILGQGSRFMWYSDRSVLRIGYTPSTMWDNEFSGDDSISFGYGGMAIGNYAIITGGYYNSVTTKNSIVMGGSRNRIDGSHSIILGGKDNTVDDDSSIILGGAKNVASNNSVVLGGLNNRSKGKESIVGGSHNEMLGDSSVIIGGINTTGASNKSILIGSNIRVKSEDSHTVVINASNELAESTVSRHIQINADNGVGIGTSDVGASQMKVAGSVLARSYYGDASLIRNLKGAVSAWMPHQAQPEFLMYPHRVGIGTSNLLEALNVNGSIQLQGEAEPVDGTIRYFNDVFSVHKNGEWVSLQIEDTNTTYNAVNSMVLDESTNTFYVATTDAVIGHVKVWNGAYWDSGFMDQFIEQAQDDRLYNFPLQKRLFLPSGNVTINSDGTHNTSNASLMLVTSVRNPTALYTFGYDSEGVERMITMSTNPPGLHFQGMYDSSQFKQTPVEGGGIVLADNQLSFYVDSRTGEAVNVLNFVTQNIGIMGDVHPNYPFYVHGSLGTRSFLFQSSDLGAGLYLRRPYFEMSPDDAEVVFQSISGELTFQAGDAGNSIVFNQVPNVVATLTNDNGQSKFALGPGKPYDALTIPNGDVHVSDGYGLEFYEFSTKMSGLTFHPSQQKRIQLHASKNDATPNLEISAHGNVGLHGPADDQYDLRLHSVPQRDAIFQLDTIDGKNPGILFNVSSAVGEDEPQFNGSGESFAIQMNRDALTLHENEAGVSVAVTVDQDSGYIGLYEHAPMAELSVGADVVLLNQSGIYLKDQNEATDPAIQMAGDTVHVRSQDRINFLDPQGRIALSVVENGVAINGQKRRDAINETPIGFEVYDTMMVSGDIYNVLNDKIFPLNVETNYETKKERSINTIEIDSVSGLTLEGNNTSEPLTVVASSYYNRIKVPDGLLEATKNMDIRFIGLGITITANNVEDRRTDAPNDTLKIINDLMSGGEINGNLNIKGDVTVMEGYTISGNVHGLRNIPYHWEHVTRNPSVADDPPGAQYSIIPPYGDLPMHFDEGEIYYLKGNVGINTSFPSTLFEVVGTSSIDELIISKNLTVSNIVSTATVQIESQERLLFRSNENSIFFGRHSQRMDSNFDEIMRITNESQWLIGTANSSFTVDVGQNSDNETTDVIFESECCIMVNLLNGNNGPSLNIRYDDTGQRFNRAFDAANIQWEASNGLAFITKDNTRSITLVDNGYTGIFESFPKNRLDVNGKLSIGFKTEAPTDSLIVKEVVGVGFSYESDDINDVPRNSLEVSGSVIVGEPFTGQVPFGFYVKGNGSNQMMIGGYAKGDELLFVSNNVSIKEYSQSHGRLMIRTGEDPGMLLQRNKSTKWDNWTQIEPNQGLKIRGSKDISFKSFDGSMWVDEMVMDENGQLGFGTVPDHVLHVKDDDSDVVVKVASKGISAIHLKSTADGDHNAMIGTNQSGLHIKINQTNLSVPDMTIVDGKIGINNTTPDDRFKLDINGTLNAENYTVSDPFHVDGYRTFQTVPTGIIVMWLGDDPVPEGWEECGVENERGEVNTMCPDMTSKFAKAFGEDYISGSQTLKDENGQWRGGGTNNAVLSESSHAHGKEVNNNNEQAPHSHTLKNSGTHSHGYGLDQNVITQTIKDADGFALGGTPTKAYAIKQQIQWHINMEGGGGHRDFSMFGENWKPAEAWNKNTSVGEYGAGAFEIIHEGGNHAHTLEMSHSHDDNTLTNEEDGGHAHGVSKASENHIHGGENDSTLNVSNVTTDEQRAKITKTIGWNNDARGVYGDKHVHQVFNQPMSRPVRFIVKVDEDATERLLEDTP
jgi:hypothetical protein